jgi:hypothetical protein
VALRRLSTSSIQTNGKSSKLWDQTTFQSGMFALATINLTSAAASVTFSGIPADYKHLQIRAITRNSSANTSDNWSLMEFNSDTTASNYYMHRIYGSGSTRAAEASNNPYAFLTLNNNNTANVFSSTIIDILDYSNTNKYKTMRNTTVWDANGSGYVSFLSGLWKNTSAVSIITIKAGVNNFTQYSSFALYGIKAG